MASAGVLRRLRNQPVKHVHTTPNTTLEASIIVISVPMACLVLSSSLAPASCATYTCPAAAKPMPSIERKFAISPPVEVPTVPTAPAKRPMTIRSTVLYACWITFASRSGIENFMSVMKILPSVRSDPTLFFAVRELMSDQCPLRKRMRKALVRISSSDLRICPQRRCKRWINVRGQRCRSSRRRASG